MSISQPSSWLATEEDHTGECVNGEEGSDYRGGSRMENTGCVQLRAGSGTLENFKAQPRNLGKVEPLGQWTHWKGGLRSHKDYPMVYGLRS